MPDLRVKLPNFTAPTSDRDKTSSRTDSETAPRGLSIVLGRGEERDEGMYQVGGERQFTASTEGSR